MATLKGELKLNGKAIFTEEGIKNNFAPKEILDYLNGEISLDEAIYILKRDTRHFVKRQLTYFKREKSTIWINANEFDRDINKIVEQMEKILYERNVI